MHMKILRLYLRYYRLSDADLMVFVQRVITGLSGNPAFTNPNPPLAAIVVLLNNFITACNNASDRSITLHAVKRQERNLLIQGMRMLASYVEVNGNNNEAILLGSGFFIYSGKNAPRPIPEIPQNLQLSDGILTGSVNVKVNIALDAVVYELRYTLDEYGPNSKWIYLPVSTASKMIITGIETGKTIWVQVRSINSKGPSNWSDPAIFRFVR